MHCVITLADVMTIDHVYSFNKGPILYQLLVTSNTKLYLCQLSPLGMAETGLWQSCGCRGLPHSPQEKKPVQETVWKLA